MYAVTWTQTITYMGAKTQQQKSIDNLKYYKYGRSDAYTRGRVNFKTSLLIS